MRGADKNNPYYILYKNTHVLNIHVGDKIKAYWLFCSLSRGHSPFCYKVMGTNAR